MEKGTAGKRQDTHRQTLVDIVDPLLGKGKLALVMLSRKRFVEAYTRGFRCLRANCTSRPEESSSTCRGWGRVVGQGQLCYPNPECMDAQTRCRLFCMIGI